MATRRVAHGSPDVRVVAGDDSRVDVGGQIKESDQRRQHLGRVGGFRTRADRRAIEEVLGEVRGVHREDPGAGFGEIDAIRHVPGCVAGCQKDFDTQYAETEQKVKDAEAQIDADMAKETKREPGEKAKTD